MIFDTPIPFLEAIRANAVRQILPVSEDTGTAALDAVPAELRRAAMFSARVSHASHLERLQAVVGQFLDPDRVTDESTGERRPALPGERLSMPEARALLRQSLADLGWTPQGACVTPGSLQDLSSRRRLDLQIQTNVRMARGYGRHQAGQTPNRLLVWPAQELVRVMARKEPRLDWERRFVDAGGRLVGGGRMVARKDDPVWVAMSRFRNPYPPFDFGSGMGLRDVRRDEALRLGVIVPGDAVRPDPATYNEEAQATLPDVDGDIREAILQSMPEAELRDGVLRLRGSP
jgi:hypothetical protein